LTLLQRIKTPFVESAAADEPFRSRPRRLSVGELLQERREELELSVAEVGDALRIRPGYLSALEQGRTEDLPGPAYAIGFVRAYAQHLGFDTEAVLERYKAEAAGLQTTPDLSLPVPLGERSLPGAAMLMVALIVAACGYGTWYFLSTGERTRPERVGPVPAALQPPPAAGQTPAAAGEGRPLASGLPPAGFVGSPAAAAPSPSAPPPAAAPTPVPPSVGTTPAAVPAAAPPVPEPPARPPAPEKVASRGAAPTAQPPAAPPAPVAAAAPPPATAPASGGEPAAPAVAGPGRITVKARADCWIQVRAPDQSIVFSRVLKAGETYRVPGRPGLYLRTGNAGALDIEVDGKAAPSIGGTGTLRRNVALDPEALAAGTAVHG